MALQKSKVIHSAHVRDTHVFQAAFQVKHLSKDMMLIFSVTSTVQVTYVSAKCDDSILQHLEQAKVCAICKAVEKIMPIGFFKISAIGSRSRNIAPNLITSPLSLVP